MIICKRRRKVNLLIALVVFVFVLVYMTGAAYKQELRLLFTTDASQTWHHEISEFKLTNRDESTRTFLTELQGHSVAGNFHRGISKEGLYQRQAPYIFQLLEELATVNFANVSLFQGGTQVKFKIQFTNGNFAIAKPMRHARDHYWAYNQTETFWFDRERHNAEIAAFHLDRILDFRRVPPCVGRRVNFREEILKKTNDLNILSTLFQKDGNYCFIGNCEPWFCNKENPVCSQGNLMELSVCQLVYPEIRHPFQDRPYPWSQGLVEAKVWKSRNICHDMLQDHEITIGRFFLDLMELAVFDHLTQNYDRHHFTIVVKFGMESFVVIIDNGKGFGNPWKDDITFLAPVYQCCRFRNSTYQTLLDLTKEGSRLGELLKVSLSQDPLYPVVTDDFYQALDRRLAQLMDKIDRCITTHGRKAVLVEKIVLN